MTTCKDCSYFFPVPENAGDFEAGKADCVIEKEDAKGKYWLSKPVTHVSKTCQAFSISK